MAQSNRGFSIASLGRSQPDLSARLAALLGEFHHPEEKHEGLHSNSIHTPDTSFPQSLQQASSPQTVLSYDHTISKDPPPSVPNLIKSAPHDSGSSHSGSSNSHSLDDLWSAWNTPQSHRRPRASGGKVLSLALHENWSQVLQQEPGVLQDISPLELAAAVASAAELSASTVVSLSTSAMPILTVSTTAELPTGSGLPTQKAGEALDSKRVARNDRMLQCSQSVGLAPTFSTPNSRTLAAPPAPCQPQQWYISKAPWTEELSRMMQPPGIEDVYGMDQRGKCLDPKVPLACLFSKKNAVDGTLPPPRIPRAVTMSSRHVAQCRQAVRHMSPNEMLQCLVACANAIADEDRGRVTRLDQELRRSTCPVGTPLQRLGYALLRALKLRVALQNQPARLAPEGVNPSTREDQGAPEDNRMQCLVEKVESASLQPCESSLRAVGEVHSRLPFLSLVASMAMNSILEHASAAGERVPVHVVVFGTQALTGIGSRTRPLIQGLGLLPQGPPPAVRVTLLDMSFSSTSRARAGEIKAGRAEGKTLCAEAKKRGVERFSFEYRNINLQNLNCLWDIRRGDGVPDLVEVEGSRERVYVCSAFQFMHVPDRVAGTRARPRQEILRWIRSLRPSLVAVAEPDQDLSSSHVADRIRGCFEHFLPAMNLHDQLIAQCTHSHEPSIPDGGFTRKRKEFSTTSSGLGGSQPPFEFSERDVYLSEECFLNRVLNMSVAPGEKQLLVHNLSLNDWKRVMREEGFKEDAFGCGTVAVAAQFVESSGFDLTCRLDGGSLLLTQSNRGLMFAALWRTRPCLSKRAGNSLRELFSLTE